MCYTLIIILRNLGVFLNAFISDIRWTGKYTEKNLFRTNFMFLTFKPLSSYKYRILIEIIVQSINKRYFNFPYFILLRALTKTIFVLLIFYRYLIIIILVYIQQKTH